MKITMTEYHDPYQKKKDYKKFLFNTINAIASTIVLAIVIWSSNGHLSKHSAQITTQNANISSSMSEEKIIAWFFAGALGYAALYAIGKNIAEK